MSTVLSYTSQYLKIPKKEVFRYLGYGVTKPDEQTDKLYRECLRDFETDVSYKASSIRIPIEVYKGRVDFGSFFAESKNLARNLKDCSQAVVFCATIGQASDIRRERESINRPSKAVMLDAIGTAAVEAWCDELCMRFEREAKDDNLFLRPRFSPGYGDLDLSLQRELLAMTDSYRKAGICLTDKLIMCPHKSVSAIVGLADSGCTYFNHDCSLCEKKDCEFRLV